MLVQLAAAATGVLLIVVLRSHLMRFTHWTLRGQRDVKLIPEGYYAFLVDLTRTPRRTAVLFAIPWVVAIFVIIVGHFVK